MTKKSIFTTSIILCAVIFATGFGTKTSVFGHVELNVSDSDGKQVWVRADDMTPLYPKQVAVMGKGGCAVIAFEIDEDGEATNIEVVSALPNRKVGKYTRKSLKKIKW
ncbi:MAG: energy transducer TonB, partial [Kangiellaceae bacterium]|nr:energy transducer TonB [Kangiellaceae bacterium]